MSINSVESDSGLIDSHCHLDMDQYKHDLNDVLQRAKSNNVTHIITIGTSVDSSKAAIGLAQKYPQISATIGVHPHDVASLDAEGYSRLKSLYQQNKNDIVAFGEIGLDFFKNYAEPYLQQSHFQHQLELAAELHLPIIIHSRDADSQTLTSLQQPGMCNYGGILHCFSSNYTYAKKILELGLLISIPGIVTYKNANTLQEVVKKLPLSVLAIETDGPYLAPAPYRGKRNEPAFVKFTAEKIAELKGIDVSEVAAQTTSNIKTLFKIQ